MIRKCVSTRRYTHPPYPVAWKCRKPAVWAMYLINSTRPCAYYCDKCKLERSYSDTHIFRPYPGLAVRK